MRLAPLCGAELELNWLSDSRRNRRSPRPLRRPFLRLLLRHHSVVGSLATRVHRRRSSAMKLRGFCYNPCVLVVPESM